MVIQFGQLGLEMMRVTLMASIVVFSASSAHAQDPVSRFLDGVFKPQPEAPEYIFSSELMTEEPVPLVQPQLQSQLVQPTPPVRRSVPRSAQPVAVSPAAEKRSLISPSQAAPVSPSIKIAAQPLPPRRPAGIGGASSAPARGQAASPVAAPVSSAASTLQVARAAAMPHTPAEAVDRVSAYLNDIDTLTARFLQTGADGRQVGGTLYVQRPGRLRFAYDPPSTLEIVADGRSVAIRDAKLRTNDVYSIGQTPLKFLLRDNVDLARDVRVRDVQIDPRGPIAITLEDSATLGGTSIVVLHFDARANILRGWMIVDPQGSETSLALSGVQVEKR